MSSSQWSRREVLSGLGSLAGATAFSNFIPRSSPAHENHSPGRPVSIREGTDSVEISNGFVGARFVKVSGIITQTYAAISATGDWIPLAASFVPPKSAADRVNPLYASYPEFDKYRLHPAATLDTIEVTQDGARKLIMLLSKTDGGG
jgi:hypothetical protein